jgi:hypothetical protein
MSESVRALSEAATGSPWSTEGRQSGGDLFAYVYGPDGDQLAVVNANLGLDTDPHADAAFIVALVNAYRSGALIESPTETPERLDIVFDVDGVISNGQHPNMTVNGRRTIVGRPGMQELFDTLAELGYHIVVWSAGGAKYARQVCEALNLHGSVAYYADKPPYPPMIEEVEISLGRLPRLQIDDDPTERVGDWPFMAWPSFRAESPTETPGLRAAADMLVRVVGGLSPTTPVGSKAWLDPLRAALGESVSPEPGLRQFVLRRTTDVSGVSGTGDVAEGVVFSDGTTVLRWLRAGGSTAVYDSLETMEAIHGHDGGTSVVFTAAAEDVQRVTGWDAGHMGELSVRGPNPYPAPAPGDE